MSDTTIQLAEWRVSENSDKAVVDYVERILSLMSPPKRVTSERRRDTRTPFPNLITLKPIDAQSLCVAGEPVTVVGRQIAARGLDFYHTEMLNFKRAIVSFESEMGQLDTFFILSLSWSRFLRPGWYNSGGRFTHIVEPVSGSGENEFRQAM